MIINIMIIDKEIPRRGENRLPQIRLLKQEPPDTRFARGVFRPAGTGDPTDHDQLRRGHMKRYLLLSSALLTMAFFALHPVPAHAEGGISLELNKLEPAGQGCRVYMVFTNATADAISSYKPDLVFFDNDGVIADRLVVEGGPLAAGKTRVKLFDVAKLGCSGIARILLNDIRACTGAQFDAPGCLSMTTTRSLSAVAFIK